MKFLSSRKIHKLKLTNRFVELGRAVRELTGKLDENDPAIGEFEKKFAHLLGFEEGVVYPHARLAVQYCLESFGLEKNSEVLMTPLSIADMVNSIHIAGLKPKFVDIEPVTFNFDVQALERAITPECKVLLITYLAGIVPDLDPILALAKKYDLKVIEDCSQAFGCRYRGQPVGSFGDVAVFSLTNFKFVSSLFGAMVLSRDKELLGYLRKRYAEEMIPADRKVLLRHALKNLLYLVLFSRWIFSYATYFLVLALEYINPDITYRLYSGNIRVALGEPGNRLLDRFPSRYFCRYTGAQARLGLASLRRAERAAEIRARHGERLRQALRAPGLTVAQPVEGTHHAYWRYPILVPTEAEPLKKHLLLDGIDSATPFLALCSQEAGFEPYHFPTPVAAAFKERALILEIDESLSAADIDRMAGSVNRFGQQGKPFELPILQN